MPTLDFAFDWVDAEGVQGPELAGTWAALTIRAGESVVTRIDDARARTVLDFVYVPLYPLAEWFASNWWFLTHEIENPVKEGNPAFRRRHALGTSREGYAFPDLEVVPSGSRTRVRWTSGFAPWTRVTFLGGGEAWVDSGEFRQVCAGLVDSVLRRLDALGVDDTFLRDEWTTVQTADDEETAFCRTAASLGWDPYALNDDRRETVLRLADTLGGLLDEAAPALGGGDPLADGTAIADAVAHAKSNVLALERLSQLRGPVCGENAAASSPWETGYGWAQGLRQRLDLDGDPLPTLETLADALSEDRQALDRAMSGGGFHGAALIDGVVTRSDDGRHGFAFRKNRPFTFCRALAEVLAQPGSDALLTRAHSERQQRNRAFAAEFLAPSSGLRQRVSRPVLDGDDIDELAVEFGVSSLVIQHQIENHGIARVV